jgi:hypothetical protein
MAKNKLHPASFRDPGGFLFWNEGHLYRQVNHSCQESYDRLMQSGLYKALVNGGWLVRHEEAADILPAAPELAYKIICPEQVDFISYPYEWSFSQLKDAALATLNIQQKALEFGMALKDASAYNIQFHQGRPVLIDTLSFEPYVEGAPWVAYRQFCQHFLAPLALMAYSDVRLNQLLRVYIDGVPLDLASSLLPIRTRLNLGLLSHIHLHAAAQKRYANQAVNTTQNQRKMGKMALLGLIDSLRSTVNHLDWKPAGTEWAEYYRITNYSDAAFEEKKHVLQRFLDIANPKTVWDLGANTGIFSRQASERNIYTIAWDIDPAAVEVNYRIQREKQEKNLLSLVCDLTNPSPGLGWANQERQSFEDRGPADMILALALIHHMAISNNVPLPRLSEYFASMAEWLVVEFVPKSDSQVQRLLTSRKDIFPDYTVESFETVFSQSFEVVERIPLKGTERILYLMKRQRGVF